MISQEDLIISILNGDVYRLLEHTNNDLYHVCIVDTKEPAITQFCTNEDGLSHPYFLTFTKPMTYNDAQNHIISYAKEVEYLVVHSCNICHKCKQFVDSCDDLFHVQYVNGVKEYMVINYEL